MTSRSASTPLATLVLLLLGISSVANAQLSRPIARDDHLARDADANKYLDREAKPDAHDDELAAIPRDVCPANLRLRWQTEVSSSVYATPVVTDLFDDGHKEIVVPSFVHYLEVLEGEDGARAGGRWPSFHESTAHASPLVHHSSSAGTTILLPTYDGEVRFYDHAGERLEKTLRVPRLRVRRDWHVGLAADHVDHARADVGAEDDERFESGFKAPEKKKDAGTRAPPHEARRRRARAMLQTNGGGGPGADDGGRRLTRNAAASFKVFDNADAGDDADEERVEPEGLGGTGEDDDAPTAHSTSFGYDRDQLSEIVGGGDEENDAFWDGTDGDGDGDDADASSSSNSDSESNAAPSKPGTRRRAGWDDEAFVQPAHRHEHEDEYVFVDAHLLCTPAIADLDGDGRDEIILSVSYFYDKEYYDNPAHAAELGVNVDIGKYVAGGVYVADLETLEMRWQTHLDLSTDAVSYRAYMYSAPTVVDIDRDGYLEIALGTSVGFLYVLRHDGTTQKRWPILMGEIQGQVAAADVDGDGYLELVAADTRGSVAAFRRDATEVWETHLASLISQGVTFGDVDGDGELELAVGTSSGAVHVLSAATGKPKPPFPFYTRGRVMSPVLLAKLGSASASDPARARGSPGGLSLVVNSFDGYVYVIDGARACVDVIDVGETSYAMPLLDDLTGDGKNDLIIASMNGVVYAYESLNSPYDPMNAWPSQVHAGNNMVARAGWYGVRALDRGYHDVRGKAMDVAFEIVDVREGRGRGGRKARTPAVYKYGPYAVVVSITAPNFSRRVAATFETPGTYSLRVDVPNARGRGRVTVRVADATRLNAEDSYSVSFHMRYYRVLKWIVVLPFAFMVGAFSALTASSPGAMPTFSSASGFNTRDGLGKLA